MKRSALAALILTAALLAPGASASAATVASHPSSLSSSQKRYLSVVEKGFRAASSRWGNRRHHWYNALLHDSNRYPLATIWDFVPLFEAADYTALASPTSENVKRVIHFADYAARYWDRNVTPAPGVRRKTPGYTPYMGSWNDPETWFDDNGWWGLAFMDAAKAMSRARRYNLSSRYVGDAKRAFTFIYDNAWDSAGGGGLWWNTHHSSGRSSEALAAGTDLAARLYQTTGLLFYLHAAEKYITWANDNIQAQDLSLIHISEPTRP